ncbi:hypothetical protein GmHk_07G019230 [Glycine max]|nr:hypothetical protein GmHk_07G019230 [Glycine max]
MRDRARGRGRGSERERERNIGWERVRYRHQPAENNRERSKGNFRRVDPGNSGRNQQNSISNWRDKKDITSFYFTRFSDDITKKELWHHFRKWGDVREVFIPNRRNNNGRRYGFVRFKGVKDAYHLAKQLDSLIIGGLKLYVNIPRYNRERPGQRASGNKLQDQDENIQAAAVRLEKPQHTNQGSYAEVLRRNIGPKGPRLPYNSQSQAHPTPISSIYLSIEPDDTNWLKDAWVGRLTNPAMFNRVEEELLWETGLDVSPKYIGDDLILLLGLTDSGAEQLMNSGQHGGESMFYSMEKWNPSIRTGFRLTWVQVWGIPLQAWHTKHLRQILAALGDMVDVDDDTEEKRRLDRARVLLKTPSRPTINCTVDVYISGECFKVVVVEETGGGSHDCRRRCCSFNGSSDEVASDASSLGNVTPRTTVSGDHEDNAWLLPAQACGTDGHDRAGTTEPETRGTCADDRQTLLLPSGHRECSYPLDKAAILRVTGLDTAASAEPYPTAIDDHDTQTRNGVVQCLGDGTAAGEGKDYPSKGKCGEGENIGTANVMKEKAKVFAEVAVISNVASAQQLDITNIKEAHMAVTEIEGHQEMDMYNIKEGGPNNKERFTNCTPLKQNQITGPLLHNNKGEYDTSCKVYSRKKWHQKKGVVGQPVPITASPIRLDTSQTQHSQGTLQEEHATSNQKESTAEKALLNEGTDKILELLNAQEAVDIWNRATKLGTTGGDVSYPVIAKLKEMEVRDKKEAERLIKKENVDMICIQETKRELIDKTMCQSLWGDTDVGWEAQPAVNTAGGILCLWSEQNFRLQMRIVGSGFIFLRGEWLREAQQVSILTIYSPCEIQHKRILWEQVRQLKQSLSGDLWCILGDFNSIREPAERFGICQRGVGLNDIKEFNDWIDDLELVEASWLGRNFTWFRPNGTARSKLDRFLLSPEWLHRWPASIRFTLPRNFSDHCPVMLRSSSIDWGPKPFRILDCWLSEKSFKETVISCWTSNQQPGWGSYVLKEKIKRLKQKLKTWNMEQFGDTLRKVKTIEEQLNKLEEDTSQRQPSIQEKQKLKQLQEALWTAAQAHESLLRQKARIKWIKQGDCNSRYFHLMLNANRRNNYLKGVMVGGTWCHDPPKFLSLDGFKTLEPLLQHMFCLSCLSPL